MVGLGGYGYVKEKAKWFPLISRHLILVGDIKMKIGCICF